MLELIELAPDTAQADDTVILPYDSRQKCRLRSRTEKGIEVGVFLPRGQVIKHGFVLKSQDDYRVRVKAAEEALSVARINDPLLFARACYHMGNRHVAMQILPGELRYLADHVLDQMLTGFGVVISHESLPFEPEPGAYHNHDH